MNYRSTPLLLLLVVTFSASVYAQNDTIGSGLADSSLVVFLRSNYTPSTTIGYNAARDSMFQSIDADETDSVTCVYSGLRAKNDGTRTPSNGLLSFNTEHSWPQSFYDEEDPMRSDIHHLYPTWSSPNSSRSNNPFGEINDNLTTSWWYWENGGSISSIPESDIDEYSEYYNNTFEPREDHKGNVARAMFYFWTIYQTNTDIINDAFDNEAFFEGMKTTLYQWHQSDPVDSKELSRSIAIEQIQGNRNPFIHDTTLVRRAYFEQSNATADSVAEIIISEVYEANGGIVKYVELFNTTENEINLASGDWQLLRYTNAGTSVSASVSLLGSIPSKSFYVVGDNDSASGVQAVFGEGFVDQDESSINHNGNDKYILLKNAGTTADTVDSFAKDNIGNSSGFASNQVAYRIYSALPNDGSFGQTSVSNDGDTVSSGNWVVFDIDSDNSNAKFVATPGYSKGIESSKNPEAVITGGAQWRLLSIPGNNASLSEITDDTPIQGIGDGNDSNVFRYNNSGSYDTPESTNSVLTNGEGLAIYFFDNTNFESKELPLVLDISAQEPSSDVTVSLNTTTSVSGSYYTMVGNPFQSNYSASAITSDNSIQNNIHVLNNGLYSAESLSSAVLLPWQGFWIESSTLNAATSVTFPVSGKTFSNATVSAFSKSAGENFAIDFFLRSSHTTDKGCTIALNSNASSAWDLWDASKLEPLATRYATLSCLDGLKEKSVHSIPFPLEGNIELPLHIEKKAVDPEMELYWQFPLNLPADIELQILDIDTGESINLKTTDTYTFSYSEEDSEPRFILQITSLLVSVEYESLPADFSLHQNYPNPFNPTTVIGFDLPQSSFVIVKIYDSLGRVIQIIANSFYNAGSHHLYFDAGNLASGTYFYSIESEFGTAFRKMMLIR